MIDLAPSLALVVAAMLADARLDTDYDVSALTCMALNVYHEARAEPVEGQLAVAFVTMNRVGAEGFPDDVCSVVTQSNSIVCQFSWVCDGNSITPRNAEAFRRALRVSIDALTGAAEDPTHGATFFVSTRIKRPGWTSRLTQTAAIDGHVFFRP
jgi:spore germination cell wall hydrolase CwlJ-like protein